MSATLQSLRSGGLGPALLARGPMAVSLLLVVLLGFRGAGLVSGLMGGTRPAAPADAATRPPALPPPVDLAALIGANLFGGAVAPGAASAGAPPITNIPLVLVGVLAATDPARGVAILGPTADAAKVYLVGAALPGGATLSAVQPDRVLINRGGSIEALLLPRLGGTPASAPPPPLQATPAERVQQLVQQNPGAITNVMRPQVVLVDGRQKGFRVFPGPNRQAFGKLGLQAGDLVTAINGTTLDDPSVGSTVFGTLATSPNARVTVTREGRQMDLVVNLAQAVSEAERAPPPPAQAPAVGPQPAAGSALSGANEPATIPPP